MRIISRLLGYVARINPPLYVIPSFSCFQPLKCTYPQSSDDDDVGEHLGGELTLLIRFVKSGDGRLCGSVQRLGQLVDPWIAHHSLSPGCCCSLRGCQ